MRSPLVRLKVVWNGFQNTTNCTYLYTLHVASVCLWRDNYVELLNANICAQRGSGFLFNCPGIALWMRLLCTCMRALKLQIHTVKVRRVYSMRAAVGKVYLYIWFENPKWVKCVLIECGWGKIEMFVYMSCIYAILQRSARHTMVKRNEYK